MSNFQRRIIDNYQCNKRIDNQPGRYTQTQEAAMGDLSLRESVLNELEFEPSVNVPISASPPTMASSPYPDMSAATPKS
jgi:hypothetical protein